MILNKETAEKVSNLFKTPHNSVQYSGAVYKDTVSFTLEFKDHLGTKSGFVAHITEDFKIYKTERLKQIWGRHKGTIINEYLPIHPEGNKTLLYSILENESKTKKVIVTHNYNTDENSNANN